MEGIVVGWGGGRGEVVVGTRVGLVLEGIGRDVRSGAFFGPPSRDFSGVLPGAFYVICRSKPDRVSVHVGVNRSPECTP